MKKMLSIVLCLLMAVAFLSIPAAAGKKLFDINPDNIDFIEIRMGTGTSKYTLNADQNKGAIYEVIRSLNDFEYEEIKDLSDYDGWYAWLTMTDKDGKEQRIEIGIDGAFDPNETKRIKCISPDPDYFGDDWLDLFFPYPLTDVDLWWDSPIKFVYDNGLMLGTSETTFSPDNLMTRGMFVTVLGRMAAVEQEDYRETVFADVGETHYAFSYVAWAHANGIVEGTNAGTFSPGTPVTREQAVILLSRFADACGYSFLRDGITYRPDFAEIQEHLVDLQDTSQEFQRRYPALYAASVMRDRDGTPHFYPADTLTRKEMAYIIDMAVEALYYEEESRWVR